jgi:uncharacterized protein
MRRKNTPDAPGGDGTGGAPGDHADPGETTGRQADVLAPATAGASDETAAVVGAYLRANPDFLNQHPEVLADLHLSHIPVGGVVSLVERQIRLLRGQLQTERARLSQLIVRARDYEAFSARLHALVLALISAPDLARVQAVLEEGLTRQFSAQAVTLLLFPVDAADQRHDHDPVVIAFRDFLDRRHALCGPLDDSKKGVLFGGRDPDGKLVRGAALIPVRTPGCCGVLAIGTADPDRFRPEMGTDLLDRLGEIVSRKLEVLLPAGPAAPAETTAEAKPRRSRPRKAKLAVLPSETPPLTEAPPLAASAAPEPVPAPKPRRRPPKPSAPD